MAPPDPPQTITLRIKVPPGHIPDGADEFRLGDKIPVGSKIGQIRERIQEAIPSSPTPERQRLLYGGRALVDDEQTLADALNIRRDPTQTEYVVHLLVKGEGANSAPVSHLRASTPTTSASPAANGTPQQQIPPQIPGAQQHHTQHHYNVSLQQLQATAFAQQQRMHQLLQQQALLQQRSQMPGVPPFGLHPTHPGGHEHGQHHGLPSAILPATAHPIPGASPGHAQQATVQPERVQAQPLPNEAQSQQPPRRPISNQGFHMEGVGPNGQRITIHQQTVNIPHGGFHGHQMPGIGQFPPPIPGLGQFPPQMPFGLPPLQGLPIQNPPRPNGPSALDRARENVAEMRRMIDELRASSATDENQQHRISELEERTQALNDYIDPFHLGNIGNNRSRTNPPQNTGAGNVSDAQVLPHAHGSVNSESGWQQRARQLRQSQQQSLNSSHSDVTCYLLSGPTGPQAILYSPQYGAYTGSLPSQSQSQIGGLRPTPTVFGHTNTTNAPGPEQGQQNQIAVQGQAEAVQQAQQQPPVGQDPLAPAAMGVMFNHMWLLLRILIFSYFLLGANLGWRRPLALLAIGVGFWLLRTGLLGDGGAVRRWWDGIMNEGRPAAHQQQNNPEGAQNQQGERQALGENAAAGRMPTPEELAQRLIDQDARIRQQRLQTLRDRFRPVERAVALLVASLWPGVGEQFVRAREEDERRRAEEEVAARRREEEERQQREEEAKKQAEEDGGSGEKGSGDAAGIEPATDLMGGATAEASAVTNEMSGSE